MLLQLVEKVQGLQADVQRGGQPISLRDEILALLSGIRIININTPRTMEYKITEYNNNKRSVEQQKNFLVYKILDKEGLKF